MKLKNINREEGFWTAFVILFLLTLSLMGLGAHVLMKGEGPNVSNAVSVVQADYAANGGAYYAMQRLELGALDENVPLVIGNGTVDLDTSSIAGTNEMLLTVWATVGETERGIEIRLRKGLKLEDMAIYTTGDVFNVSARDSVFNLDPERCVANADSVPTINQTALDSMSTAQGHDQWDNPFRPDDQYPDSSFYQPDGITPNVTHVMNDFKVAGGRTVYGIFVVEGDVTLDGSSRIEGVIYLPNPTSTIIHGGGTPTEATISGGIISHGDISGTGNHISVQHWPEFMRVFCEFQIGPDPVDMPVIKWEYI